jgi:hypothetical protein
LFTTTTTTTITTLIIIIIIMIIIIITLLLLLLLLLIIIITIIIIILLLLLLLLIIITTITITLLKANPAAHVEVILGLVSQVAALACSFRTMFSPGVKNARQMCGICIHHQVIRLQRRFPI